MAVSTVATTSSLLWRPKNKMSLLNAIFKCCNFNNSANQASVLTPFWDVYKGGAIGLSAAPLDQYNLHMVSGPCDLKVSRFQANIDENFANYFLNTKANTKCFIVLKCTFIGLQKSISELERKNQTQGVATLQSRRYLKNWWDYL